MLRIRIRVRPLRNFLSIRIWIRITNDLTSRIRVQFRIRSHHQGSAFLNTNALKNTPFLTRLVKKFPIISFILYISTIRMQILWKSQEKHIFKIQIRSNLKSQIRTRNDLADRIRIQIRNDLAGRIWIRNK